MGEPVAADGASTDGDEPLPRLIQHPDEPDRAVVGLLDREVDVSPGRLGTFVEVSVEVDRAHRYLAQRVVAQGQRRVGGAQETERQYFLSGAYARKATTVPASSVT